MFRASRRPLSVDRLPGHAVRWASVLTVVLMLSLQRQGGARGSAEAKKIAVGVLEGFAVEI